MEAGVVRFSFQTRVNLFIVVFGAFCIIAGIKLTTLLPTKYYFSFSKIVAGSEGPFLVDPPSVSGQKMCELLKRYGVSEAQLGRGQIDCRLIRADEIPSLTAEQKDGIYSLILRIDPALRRELAANLANYRIPPLGPDEWNLIANDGKTRGGIYEQAILHFKNEVSNALGAELANRLDQEIDGVLGPATEGGVAERPQLDVASAAELQRIRSAINQFRTDFNSTVARVPLEPYTKTRIDEMFKRSGNRRVFGHDVVEFYNSQIGDRVASQMQAAFASHGLPVATRTQTRNVLFAEMSADGLRNYLVSIGLRLAPVAVFAFFAGLMFGRAEVASVGAAAFLAALLLCWPVMYGWDQMVAHQWQGYRKLFTAFYILYVVAFFFTGRMMAMSGAYIRQLLAGAGGTAQHGNRIAGREVAVNLLVGIVLNTVVHAANAAIPLVFNAE